MTVPPRPSNEAKAAESGASRPGWFNEPIRKVPGSVHDPLDAQAISARIEKEMTVERFPDLEAAYAVKFRGGKASQPSLIGSLRHQADCLIDGTQVALAMSSSAFSRNQRYCKVGSCPAREEMKTPGIIPATARSGESARERCHRREGAASRPLPARRLPTRATRPTPAARERARLRG